MSQSAGRRRTGRCSGRRQDGHVSVDGQRAVAARLNRLSANAARPRQWYYRPSRWAFAAERHSVGRTGVWWWRVRTVVGRDRGCAGRTVAARSFGRRVLQLETVEFETSPHGTAGGGQLVAASGASN